MYSGWESMGAPYSTDARDLQKSRERRKHKQLTMALRVVRGFPRELWTALSGRHQLGGHHAHLQILSPYHPLLNLLRLEAAKVQLKEGAFAQPPPNLWAWHRAIRFCSKSSLDSSEIWIFTLLNNALSSTCVFFRHLCFCPSRVDSTVAQVYVNESDNSLKAGTMPLFHF